MAIYKTAVHFRVNSRKILARLGIFWVMNEGVGGVCSKAHWHSQIAASYATEFCLGQNTHQLLRADTAGSEANARKTTGADGAVALFTALFHSPNSTSFTQYEEELREIEYSLLYLTWNDFKMVIHTLPFFHSPNSSSFGHPCWKPQFAVID